jgi:hypothetical protein
MSGSDLPAARTLPAAPSGLAAPGPEFGQVRRLSCWQVRRAAELLRSVGVDPDTVFGVVGYGGVIEVPFYDERHIFALVVGDTALVFADGPQESPHRYARMALCMWYPDDPTNARWTPDNGIDDLLYRVRNHLFREAWWRETKEWLGVEAPHGAAA